MDQQDGHRAPESGSEDCDDPVTVDITWPVKPGRDEEFEEFLSGITNAGMKFQGHLGTNIFRLTDSSDYQYRTIFKFDSETNLQRWLDSEERRLWIERAKPLLEQGIPEHNRFTGLEAWFAAPGQQSVVPPPRYKVALITWVAIFPLVTILFALLGPAFEYFQVPLLPRTMVITGIVIPLMTWVVMPQMTRLFSGWLHPETKGEDKG